MKCTRREWLGLGLGAGASVFGGRWNLSFAGEKTDSGPVNMTVIPSSGEQVPAVGLGTVKFQGNPDSDDLSQLRQTLQTFHRLGGRVLDTSPNYGSSESVLGRLLADLDIRDDVFMATKIDREDRESGERRMEGSFDRLGGTIDLMQVHNLRGKCCGPSCAARTSTRRSRFSMRLYTGAVTWSAAGFIRVWQPLDCRSARSR